MIGHYKQVIDDRLRSRKDGRRTTEVGVAIHVLNRMLELGRRISGRIHDIRSAWGGAAYPAVHATTPL
jgi:hypothetical protein